MTTAYCKLIISISIDFIKNMEIVTIKNMRIEKETYFVICYLIKDWVTPELFQSFCDVSSYNVYKVKAAEVEKVLLVLFMQRVMLRLIRWTQKVRQ